MQLRATMRGLPWSSGLFQRGLGRPGTSGKSQNDVINGHGDWHDRSGIVTGGMSCFTASRRKRKENRHYCLLGLLLPLWASVLERKKKKWKLAQGFWKVTLKLAACLGTALFVCPSV